MSISKFKKLRIKILGDIPSPTHLLAADAEGNVGKTPYPSGGSGNIDGGFANSTYTSSQQINGGSAS